MEIEGFSSRVKNRIGDRCGRLTVISYGGKSSTGTPLWRCVCDCGVETIVHANALSGYTTKSCGCLQKERRKTNRLTHGKSKARIYFVWKTIRQRCINPNSRTYHYYGGRGILLAKEFEDFDAFYSYVESLPEPKEGQASLDRIDNDLGYVRGNLRWASHAEQNKNRRNTIKIRIGETDFCLVDVARQVGISRKTLRNRLLRGAPLKDALFKGVQ